MNNSKKLRLLWLIQYNEPHAFEVVADSLRKHIDVDIRRLSSSDQANLKKYFKRHVVLDDHDRIMTILRSKKEMRQSKFMSTIPNHIVLEYDACQNYIKSSKYFGRFSKHFQKLDGSRIIVSGSGIQNKLTAEGFDAHFIPKGYDDTKIFNMNLERDIELGFIGTLKSNGSVYDSRKAMLENIKENSTLEIIKTEWGASYANMLNRIRIFVSADVGLNEYMAKNYEAMGAGCLLMTYSQGDEENKAVGFVDGENVMTYSSLGEFLAKLAWLKNNPDEIKRIANNGNKLALEKFSYSEQAKFFLNLIVPNFPVKSKRRFSYFGF